MAVPKNPHLFTWGLSKNEIIYIYILVYRYKGITLVKPKIRVSIITSGCQGYIKNQVSGQTHQTLPGSLCHLCSIHFNPVQHDHFMPDLSQTGHCIQYPLRSWKGGHSGPRHDLGHSIRTSCWTNLAQYPAPSASLVAPGPKALWI